MVHKSGRIGCLLAQDLLYCTTYQGFSVGFLGHVYWQVQVSMEPRRIVQSPRLEILYRTLQWKILILQLFRQVHLLLTPTESIPSIKRNI